MKQTIVRKAVRVALGSFLIFSLAQCTKSGMHEEEGDMGSKRSDKSANLKKEYRAALSPLNNSGVSGTAMLSLEGNMLTVTITAMGLEPGKTHVHHTHGFTDNTQNSTCPTTALDTNGDGLIDLGESVPAYGPVVLDFGALPVDAMGNASYTKTYTVAPSLMPLQNRAIVLHGLTVNGTYMVTLPVACGQIQSASNGMMGN
jgi:Cu/Zn superoxide dismutase